MTIAGNPQHALIKQIEAARRVSTPLIGITTPDPEATINSILEILTAPGGSAGAGGSPVYTWDIIRGFRPRNEIAKDRLADLVGDGGDLSLGNPPEAMKAAAKLYERGIIFVHLANRWLVDPMMVQAIWLLRDQFKRNFRTLVLLGPSLELPPELAGDVVVLDEPLPAGGRLSSIAHKVYKDAQVAFPGDEVIDRVVEAVQGLSAFQAEQVIAMSLTRKGVDLPALWERKRRQIELTPGLKVVREDVTFEGIGGVSVVKDFLGRVLKGQSRPSAVVFIDEIEKMLSGASTSGGDTSGVAQDQLGALLSYMQDQHAVGVIFIGPPGSAKSMVAKAAGNEAGIPTIQLDLGAAKGSLVGQSENQLRNALKVITSVSNGRSLWVATCNSIGSLPPELRRRFTLGTFFFDLPTPEERAAIWKIHRRHFGLVWADGSEKGVSTLRDPAPPDEGWTGAEIRQCCDIAWRLGCPLDEAAKFVVPVARSAADQIKALRHMASGRFLSASYPGVYRDDHHEAAGTLVPADRALELTTP